MDERFISSMGGLFLDRRPRHRGGSCIGGNGSGSLPPRRFDLRRDCRWGVYPIIDIGDHFWDTAVLKVWRTTTTSGRSLLGCLPTVVHRRVVPASTSNQESTRALLDVETGFDESVDPNRTNNVAMEVPGGVTNVTSVTSVTSVISAERAWYFDQSANRPAEHVVWKLDAIGCRPVREPWVGDKGTSARQPTLAGAKCRGAKINGSQHTRHTKIPRPGAPDFHMTGAGEGACVPLRTPC